MYDLNITAAFTAQIDVFELLAGTGKPLALQYFELGQTSEVTDAQDEVLTLLLKRVTGAPTSGSGGTTAAGGAALVPNDTASGATIEAGNTTKLTGGTATNIARIDWYIRQPCIFNPIPEMMPILDAGTRFVLELVTTPADSISGIQGFIGYSELV